MLADEDKSRGDADSVPGSKASVPPKFKILFCDMDGIFQGLHKHDSSTWTLTVPVLPFREFFTAPCLTA